MHWYPQYWVIYSYPFCFTTPAIRDGFDRTTLRCCGMEGFPQLYPHHCLNWLDPLLSDNRPDLLLIPPLWFSSHKKHVSTWLILGCRQEISPQRARGSFEAQHQAWLSMTHKINQHDIPWSTMGFEDILGTLYFPTNANTSRTRDHHPRKGSLQLSGCESCHPSTPRSKNRHQQRNMPWYILISISIHISNIF